MEDEKVKNEALQIIGLHQNRPVLVVFDLDNTLWPFYWYSAPTAPFLEECHEDYVPNLFPQARGILHALKDSGIDMALASRSPTSERAKTFLDKLGIQSMFVAKEIFASSTHKTDHFQKIHRNTEVPLTSMLFFDDEDRNAEAVSENGVTSILVQRGVDLGALRQGLSKFSQKSGSSNRPKEN